MTFRGRQNAKLQYAVLAAAGVHGGTEPDLLDAELAGRAGIAVAARLGRSPATFPGGHEGFNSGEPDAFAATLREILSQS